MATRSTKGTKEHPTITILGAGVIGLTSAVSLLEAGYSVSIRADRFAPDITSSVAAGLWYPYAAGGPRIPDLAIQTLQRYQVLAKNPDSGVRFVPCTCYEREENLHPFWAEEDVAFEPMAGGFRSVLPIADSSLFLSWLVDQIEVSGGVIESLHEPVEHFESLDADVIVNCTGLGARRICRDTRMTPIKGTVVVVDNPGIDYCLTDDTDESTPTYFIPTAAGLILGGTAEAGVWDTETDPVLVDDIIGRCAEHEPRLTGIPIRAVKSGLRPGRDEVRLEQEHLPSGKTVIHNYGHGGSGYTLCWGCANEIVEFIRAI